MSAPLPPWLVESRRQICIKCEAVADCPIAFVGYFVDPSPCPRKAHPSWPDAIAAKAWPVGVEPVSGCCDPP